MSMDNCVDAMEKVIETLAAKFEGNMSSMQTSTEELKTMMGTLLKGKGVATSDHPDHSATTGDQVSSFRHAHAFQLGAGGGRVESDSGRNGRNGNNL